MEEARKAPIIGLILFLVGIPLFLTIAAIGPGALILVVPTILLLLMGWGLAFASVARHSSSSLNGTIILLLVLFTFGMFYLFPDHIVHVGSGLGFGLPHTPEGGPVSHVIIGFVLLIITMAITSAIALRKTTASS